MLTLDVLNQVIGWIGSIVTLIAYALVSANKVTSRQASYQWMNLIGASFVGFNVFVNHAWPALFMEVCWVAVAVITLIKILCAPKLANRE